MTIGQKIPQTPKVYTKKELKIKKELKKFKNCYIFVNTNFKRKNEPILSLVFSETKRNIYIDKNLLIFKSEEDILKVISNIIKQHYKYTEGKLQIWGNIVNYVYHQNEDIKYVFDINGEEIKDIEINENKANLNI